MLIAQHVKRQIVLGALRKAQTKATLLVIRAKTQSRSDMLTQLIANISREASELAASEKKGDVELEKVVASPSALQMLWELKITTVYDLATSEPKRVTEVLRNEDSLIRQVLRTVQYPPPSRRIPLKK
jgi:hypothetical protein